ncbi:MAG: N-acetylmuramoyl-L-alanine amidase [Acidobacteria bacterium]|nr:MAG: N-acetylmuramoyl-L-alanine amidase [Acidobacteriota bacterium]
MSSDSPAATSRRAPVLLPVLLLLLAAAASAATYRVPIGDGMVATYTDEPALYLETEPLAGEGLLAFARRLTGSAGHARAIAKANDGSRRLLAGVRYRVPYELLLDDYRVRVVRGLFTEDRAQPDGWLHVILPETQSHGLWHVARWFTGDGERFTAIRDHNALTGDTELDPNQRILVPRYLLLPAFQALLPPPPAAPYGLRYGRDENGEYAVYRLRAGEALYSSVVVRFTGRTYASDVNALAADLARLNNIPDVTDMRIGQEVRIPLDLLLPEFLPPGHPRRAEYEKGLSDSARYSNTVRAARLEGITVILDPGHGGQDPGAVLHGVWESIYVYDIALRVRKLLLDTTAARVELTTRDGDDGFRILDRDVLPRSRAHRVLTTPPYPIEDPTPGIHFRWYLANSIYKKALARNGGDVEKVVFLSIHADALHPSLRGAMIYVPASSLTRGEFGKRGSVYARRQEFREQPKVSFSWKERTRSEGFSRQLAEKLIASLRQRGVLIHPEKPIRDRIIRSRRSRPFVPAVVRHNAVPAKLLVEVCNLANRQDRKLIQTRTFRQQVAEALTEGIMAYYGQTPPSANAVAGRSGD